MHLKKKAMRRYQGHTNMGLTKNKLTHLPTSIVYKITPNDHISAALPEYIVFAFRISGETYAGQPRLSCNKSSLGLSNTTASSNDSKRKCVLQIDNKISKKKIINKRLRQILNKKIRIN